MKNLKNIVILLVNYYKTRNFRLLNQNSYFHINVINVFLINDYLFAFT